MTGKIVTKLISFAFATAAGIAVFTAPVVWAQEGTNAIDLSNLVFMKGKAYAVTYEDGVTTKADGTSVVRKIGYGKTSFVNITTTASGTYSSDGMTSPHVLYPGIHVEEVPLVADRDADRRSFISRGSFVVLAATPNGAIVTSSEGFCVLTATIIMC